MRGAARRAWAPVGAAAILACAAEGAPAPLRLSIAPAGADTRITLVAEPGLEVNARVAPALELPDGRILRFDGARTADSSSFAEPASALLPGRHTRVHGTLRASVCRKEERICRSFVLET